MHITNLTLDGYTLFKDSGISKLTVTFTDKVQIIIGSNGCGKSSLLRQLSPYTSVRSLFDKTGRKILTYTKDGTEYRLESDYEKPSSPHLFYEGDNQDNLNIGRTTTTQADLIVQYLGITSLIDDLIMNRYVFPKWGLAQRKDFLMKVNPDEIGFILPLIKQQATKIKACKNNLARLQARKIVLEQDFLSEEALLEITEEQTKISNDLAFFQQCLMDIEIGSRTLPIAQPVSFDATQFRKTLKQCHYQLSALSHVARDDDVRRQDRERILTRLAVGQQKLTDTNTQIIALTEELADLEVRYRELMPDADVHQIDVTIERLEAEHAKLDTTRPLFELSLADLEQRYLEWEELKDRLLIFENLSVPIYSMKKRQMREARLSQAQYRYTSLAMRQGDLETQLETLSKRHKLKPSDIPDAPCAKDRCPLYNHFMGNWQNTAQQKQEVSYQLARVMHKHTRLSRYIPAMVDYLKASKPYADQMRWMINTANTNPILHHVLRQMDVIAVLQSTPNKIAKQVREVYHHIEQWEKLKTVKADLDVAHSLKSRQISAEDRGTITLVSDIARIKNTLTEHRRAIMVITRGIAKLKQALADNERFTSIKHTVLTLQQTYLSTIDAMAHGYERNRLAVLKTHIEALRSQHFMRMSEIERVLRVQSGLQERYQEEVLSQMVGIDKELKDLQQIETALIAIPKEIIIDFINLIFDQANRFIESVWTVPFRIEPVKYEDPLTYEFQVSGDNQSTREMADCSDGQTEILSLVINLSLRVILGHLNYPLALDEVGRTFDHKHKYNLVLLLKRLLDEGIVSQLFVINHHASVSEGFANSETFVIREENVLLPEVFNKHVDITHM